ncbi:hypothetical protein GNT69_21370 [Bacillus sp. B15-48]|nr:hypothetical protein [Bacillus sp. B15-48]
MKEMKRGVNLMKLYSNTIIMSEEKGSKGDLLCKKCETVLCSSDSQDWKSNVVLDERPLKEVAGKAYSSTGEDVLFRQFFCPDCGGLLDSEIALKGEPFLKDRVWV